MRFKIDENLSAAAVALLTGAGHDAMTVPDEGLTGITDPELAKVTKREKRAIVTQDTDFLNTINYLPEDFPGSSCCGWRAQAGAPRFVPWKSSFFQRSPRRTSIRHSGSWRTRESVFEDRVWPCG